MITRISTNELVQKYKAIYLALKPIDSYAIGEMVFFNISGFKHLIYKGQHRRDTATIYNRLVLIPLIAPVIRNCQEIIEIRIRSEVIKKKIIQVTYYALESRVGKDEVRVRVVVRKVGDSGKSYFYSIMKY